MTKYLSRRYTSSVPVVIAKKTAESKEKSPAPIKTHIAIFQKV